MNSAQKMSSILSLGPRRVKRSKCRNKNVFRRSLTPSRENCQGHRFLHILITITNFCSLSLCQKSHPNIIVKFFPSINISYGTEEASENFALFSELRKEHPEVVRGIDLGGDPTKGKFSDYKHIFEKARSEGFRLALHCGEVVDDQGIVDMLMFMTKDDRIGHGTFIDGKLFSTSTKTF